MSNVKNKKRKSKVVITILVITISVIFSVTQKNEIINAISSSNLLGSQIVQTNLTSGDTSNKTTNQTSPIDQSPGNSSYLMVNSETQEAIIVQNDTLPRPSASTVKLLTGLVVMEKLDKNGSITVGNEVVDIEGSKIGLQAGDTITVEELLTAMYVLSANDAASALAVGAYGSLEEFVLQMNRYAKEIGCTNSEFKTPHGLPHDDQYTTAHDLTKIASTFIQNESLMKYVQMKESTVEWTNVNGLKVVIPVKNTNELLKVYPGDYGLKTGTTTEAGQCLVSYVKNSDGEFILTLLGSKDRYEDTINLLDKGLTMIRTHKAMGNIISNPNSFTTTPGFYVP